MCSRTSVSRCSRRFMPEELVLASVIPGLVSVEVSSAAPACDPVAHAMHAPKLLDSLVEATEDAACAVAEQLRLETVADELAGDRVDALRAGAGPRADDALELMTAEEQPYAVVERPSSRQCAVAYVRQPDRQPLRLP